MVPIPTQYVDTIAYRYTEFKQGFQTILRTVTESPSPDIRVKL